MPTSFLKNIITIEIINKCCPTFISTSPKSFIREFLGGLFGGNGFCPNLKSNKNTFSNVKLSLATNVENKILLENNLKNIIELMKKLDVEAEISKNKEYYEATQEERKEYKKEYYEEKKDKLKEQMKEYRENNKEQKKEYDKEYREANKEHRKEQKKEYYEANKEKIKEQQKEKINCLCGSIFCKSDKAKHEKTEKHKIFINSLLLK